MPKITYYVAASLDGYIADVSGGVDWLPQDESNDYGYADFYSTVDALAMGRRTYDQVLGFGEWPYAGKRVYVFTSNPPDDDPYRVEFVRADPTEFVQTLAARHSGTVWLVGGGNLADQFRRAGLIDDYLVFVIPVILGRGIPLFDGDAPLTALESVTTQTYDDGVVMLHYRPVAG
ncbi:MAG: dihydrofolate reductase [Dehalococcoidia bacterium]|nr:dihydrofolate reductase [Dehalococcoidia bacterium]